MTLARSELIPVDQFELAWRITDARWDELDEAELAKMRFISSTRAKDLREQARAFQAMGPYYPKPGEFGISSFCLLVEETSEDTTRIDHWFANLPVDASEQVYVVWASLVGNAAAMDWRTFAKHRDSFWYPFDVVDVFDDSFTWAISLGQEDVGFFLKRGEPHAVSNTEIIAALRSRQVVHDIHGNRVDLQTFLDGLNNNV